MADTESNAGTPWDIDDMEKIRQRLEKIEAESERHHTVSQYHTVCVNNINDALARHAGNFNELEEEIESLDDDVTYLKLRFAEIQESVKKLAGLEKILENILDNDRKTKIMVDIIKRDFDKQDVDMSRMSSRVMQLQEELERTRELLANQISAVAEVATQVAKLENANEGDEEETPDGKIKLDTEKEFYCTYYDGGKSLHDLSQEEVEKKYPSIKEAVTRKEDVANWKECFIDEREEELPLEVRLHKIEQDISFLMTELNGLEVKIEKPFQINGADCHSTHEKEQKYKDRWQKKFNEVTKLCVGCDGRGESADIVNLEWTKCIVCEGRGLVWS